MANNRIVACLAVLLAGGCSLIPLDSDLKLIESGYSLDFDAYHDEFAIWVHLNQLKQLGGDPRGAEFNHFVSERLSRHGFCRDGWEMQLCAEEAQCIRRTRSSVMVLGRCIPQ
jgi:hypothetical protein